MEPYCRLQDSNHESLLTIMPGKISRNIAERCVCGGVAEWDTGGASVLAVITVKASIII